VRRQSTSFIGYRHQQSPVAIEPKADMKWMFVQINISCGRQLLGSGGGGL